MAKQAAEAFKLKIERLVTASMTKQPLDTETQQWLESLDSKMMDKLAKVDLISPALTTTLGDFLTGYTELRTDVKNATQTVYGHTIRNLKDFFGSDTRLGDITEADADEWCLYLKEEKLSPNTIRRRSGIAKQFFKHAVKKKLIPSNPFAELAASVQANKSREHFITQADAKKLLDSAPDADWRMIIALSRYGGLRCPSEVLLLKWSDINHETGRILVTSPKTEHHAGKDSRVIPLFPELVPYLEDCFQLNGEKSEYVITRYRDQKQNLRTTFQKIIKRAGLKQWPKLFQNMRASRETELCNDYPTHVVCEWLGNSVPVAMKHYLQITDEHYEKASQERCIPACSTPPSTPDQPRKHSEHKKSPDTAILANAGPYDCTREKKMGDEGLEPPTLSV
ncbi:tyrosine-type recombinase/integrase [Gimesia panareensis]|uniref:tyrosine-type recombinase/integrase n=1 Tax=Gimesia panareensis TaxID=2527978 RepID=UPI0036F3E44D